MRKLALIMAAILMMPALAFADISLTASAGITAGTSIGPTVLLKCKGYDYSSSGDPWTQCTNEGSSTTMNFGDLTTQLKDSSGNDTGGAGCFYAPNFFILYLFPEAHGGKYYLINQQATSSSDAILNALVVTPVYSQYDKFSASGSDQGVMDSYEETNNPNVNTTQLAKNSVTIFKSKRARIVRAEYGIPPYPASGTPLNTPVALDTALGAYTVSVQLTVSEGT